MSILEKEKSMKGPCQAVGVNSGVETLEGKKKKKKENQVQAF